MNNSLLIQSNNLFFIRWTRTSYAIFNSIGKLIQISHLIFDIHCSIFNVLFSSKKRINLDIENIKKSIIQKNNILINQSNIDNLVINLVLKKY